MSRPPLSPARNLMIASSWHSASAVFTRCALQRVFVVGFRPGHGPEETEQQQMELLSTTIAFLVANGNNATDEVWSCVPPALHVCRLNIFSRLVDSFWIGKLLVRLIEKINCRHGEK